jgi:pyruvate dehydrogenase E2 component (dihydrolipoamide acetyltransferase)
LAIDLPGHGGSTKEVGAGDVAALQGAVADLMDALGIARAHLVGHSLGAAICLALALDQPERVASATLVCPAGLGPEISIDYIDGFLATSRARKLRPILELLVADPKIVTSEMVEDVLKMKRLDGVEAALNRIATACFAGGRQALQLTPRLGELRVPVQVIWGEADRIIPPRHAEGLAPAIKVSRLAGAGHLAHMEKAGEVNALIEAMVGG